MNYPFVSIVVVNYNGKNFLHDCFSALEAIDYPRDKYEIIMVDNGSRDGSQLFVKNHFPRVVVLQSKENNYCTANNSGVKHASGDYVALLNNDTIVDSGWLKALIRVMCSEDTIGAVSSKILFMNGRIQSVGHHEYPHFYWVDKGHNEEDVGQYEDIAERVSVSGCCVLYRKEAFEAVGGLDEDFEIFLEDVDISYRLRNAGWKIVYVPHSIVRHFCHGVVSDEYVQYRIVRNRLFFVIKHAHKKLPGAINGIVSHVEKCGLSVVDDVHSIVVAMFRKLLNVCSKKEVNAVLDELEKELSKTTTYVHDHYQKVLVRQKEQIAALQDTCDEKEAKVCAVMQELKERDELFQKIVADMESRLAENDEAVHERMKPLQEKLRKEKDELERRLSLEIEGRDRDIWRKGEEIKRLSARVEEKKEELRESDRLRAEKINENETLLRANLESEQRASAEINGRDRDIWVKEQEITRLGGIVSEHKELLAVQQKTYEEVCCREKKARVLADSLSREIEGRDRDIWIKDQEITRLGGIVSEHKELLAAQQESYEEVCRRETEVLKSVDSLSREIEGRDRDIWIKDQEIDRLTEIVSEHKKQLEESVRVHNEAREHYDAKREEWCEAQQQQVCEIAERDRVIFEKEQALLCVQNENAAIKATVKELNVQSEELQAWYSSKRYRYVVKPLNGIVCFIKHPFKKG